MRMADYFVHETAIVDAGAEIGAGTRIWHFCHVMPGSRIGERCVLGQNVVVSPAVVVGNGCKIQNNVSLYTGVTLEDEVFLGPSMVFTNVVNPRAFIERKTEFRPTRVGRGATIGANATIVCGVTLGAYCLVGAGAVVTRSLPDHALAHGAPARIHGWACVCGETLTLRVDAGAESGACAACGRQYRRDAETVRIA
jgi:UDP-2-acetamido-3-amino-2,3-dideoxy-glucuronate N-acetyltransferase